MAVLLAEHRLERCLAAADRVVALDEGAIAFDGAPGGFCDWALATDPALATPGARLFSLAGLAPPPVSVKEARARLRAPRDRGDRGRRRPSRRRRGARAAARGRAALDGPRPVGRARSGRRRPRRPPRARARDRAGRAGGADGPKRRRQEHPAARRRGTGRAGAGDGRPRRAAARCCRRARPTCSSASGSPTSCPARPGARALEAVGLGWAGEADPRDLSGGERQRLALAIVMAGRAAGRAAGAGLPRRADPRHGRAPASTSCASWLGELAARRGGGASSRPTTSSSPPAFASRVVLLGDGELIADGPADEILSGGWYFATEVARILGAAGAITPEQGAELLRRPPRPAEALPLSWQLATFAGLALVLAGGFGWYERSRPTAAPGGAGRRAGGARGRRPAGPGADPERRRDHRHRRCSPATRSAPAPGSRSARWRRRSPTSGSARGRGPPGRWPAGGWSGSAAPGSRASPGGGSAGSGSPSPAALAGLRLRRAARPLGDGHLRRRAVARPLPGALGARDPVQRRPRGRQLR